MSGHQTFECEIPLRTSDLNVASHVDNAVLVALASEARSAFFAAVGGLGPVVVAQQSMEYRREVRLDRATPLRGRVWIGHLGSSSLVAEVELCHGPGEPSAVAEATIVLVDEHGRPRRLGDDQRGHLSTYLGAPVPMRPPATRVPA